MSSRDDAIETGRAMVWTLTDEGRMKARQLRNIAL